MLRLRTCRRLVSRLLWPPCGIGQAIIFSSCDFVFVSSFFLLSAPRPKFQRAACQLDGRPHAAGVGASRRNTPSRNRLKFEVLTVSLLGEVYWLSSCMGVAICNVINTTVRGEVRTRVLSHSIHACYHWTTVTFIGKQHDSSATGNRITSPTR